MFRPRTGRDRVSCGAAAMTVAVRETSAGLAPSPSALPARALIVALNGNDVKPGHLGMRVELRGLSKRRQRDLVNARIPEHRSEKK